MNAEQEKKLLDFGLLIIRIGLGITFIMHGFPKILGGPQTWEKVGGAMGFIGINFGFQFWGFMAALSEFAGGILLLIGLFVRGASAFLFITMAVAAIMHLGLKHDFKGYAHALEAGIVFLGLIFTGAGKYDFKFLLKQKS
ncbi:MAG: DoxX family protein [Candidatus Omnitrophica bacterium]|nr:DoxX family protein [Candidatus Omnitrophota bacterium]